MEIVLPHRFKHREYQKPSWIAREKGIRFFDLCWHRRTGKDKNAINFTAREMMERVGTYFHMLPFYEQGRKAIWNGMDRDGMKFTDHFPQELRARTNEQQMRIELLNGSAWQVVGADNIDSLVGTNPVGVVYSEWPLMNPKSWDFFRPILMENGGWAMFIYTPRGHNHAYHQHEMAKHNPSWFAQRLTVDDTSIITPQMIDEERRSGMPEDLIQQEYYCSFEAAIPGSYFGDQITAMREQDRIRELPFDKDLLVYTFWDLGMRDAMACWFGQIRGDWIDLFDYEERTGEGLQFWASLLEEKAIQKGYRYATHYAPHDIKVREIGTGKSRLEIAESLGLVFDVVPRVEDKMDSIQAARRIFPRVRIDRKLAYAIDCLTQYHKKYDEDRKVYASKPEHDWTSNCADAFQTMAMAVGDVILPTDDDGPSFDSLSGGALG